MLPALFHPSRVWGSPSGAIRIIAAALSLTLTCAAAAPDVVSRADSLREIDQKMQRVKSFLQREKLAGVLLSKVNNFSWITAGLADNHIVITSEAGTSSLLIMDDGRKYVVTSNSEMPRQMAEDLQGLGYEPREYKWYEDKTAHDRKLAIIRKVARGLAIGSDVTYADLRVIDSEFASLRYELTDNEIAKYRWLGQESTAAVIAVCRRLQPGMTEHDMEAMASDELMRRGIRPTVLLMGVDDRALRFRHPVPTDRKLTKYAMVNVCARRWGLVISTCRYVHFGPVPEDLKRRVHASAEMTARYLNASTPGAKADDILSRAKTWYSELGFPGELELHHQGGAIGYAEREWVAFPGSAETIHERQALAWNPIIQGALSFDTFIVYHDRAENLSEVTGWPSITVQIRGREARLPDILER